MVSFIELKTSKNAFTDAYTRELINSALIRSVKDRPGYGEPMVTISIDAGSKGHHGSPGANSVFKEMTCYEVYDELVAALTERRQAND